MSVEFFYNGKEKVRLSKEKAERYYHYLIQHGCQVVYDSVEGRIDMTGSPLSTETQLLYQDNITPTFFHYKAFQIVKEILTNPEVYKKHPFLLNLSFARKSGLEKCFMHMGCCGEQAWRIAKNLYSSPLTSDTIIKINKKWNSLQPSLLEIQCFYPETMDGKELEEELKHLAIMLFISIQAIR